MDAMERIKKLESELYMTRLKLLSIVPEKFHEIFRSYCSCETRESTYHWYDDAAERIIDLSVPLSPEHGSYWRPRAYCPLCGDGSQSPYDEGFALPEGLRRHLTGWGNSRQCVVTEAAFEIARTHFHEKFSAAEQAERTQHHIKHAERLQTESLLRIGPTQEPELMNEGSFLMPPRDLSEMAAAEARLLQLGFVKSEDGRVVQYYLDTDSHGVYADPRRKTEIQFNVYKKPFPKKIRRDRINRAKYFTLKDSWKNDLKGKFEARLSKAL
jgi:hypothetical protein